MGGFTNQFRPRVLRYLTRLVGEADGEDLTQSVMLKVSEGLAGFRGDSSASTWIYSIARGGRRFVLAGMGMSSGTPDDVQHCDVILDPNTGNLTPVE